MGGKKNYLCPFVCLLMEISAHLRVPFGLREVKCMNYDFDIFAYSTVFLEAYQIKT